MSPRPKRALPLVLLAVACGAAAGLGFTFFTGGGGLEPVLSVALVATSLLAAITSVLVERRRRRVVPGAPVVWPVLRAVLATCGGVALGLLALSAVGSAVGRPQVVKLDSTGEPVNGPPDPCAPKAYWNHLAVQRVQAAFPGYAVALARRCQANRYGDKTRKFWVRVGRFTVPGGHTALVVDEAVYIDGDRASPRVSLGPYRSVAEALEGARLVDGGSVYAKAGTDQVCFLGYNDMSVPWNLDTDDGDIFLNPEPDGASGWFSVACRKATVVARDQRLLMRHRYAFDAALAKTVARYKLWVPHAADDP